MPIVQLPSIGDDPTIEDVVDAFERLRKELTWLLDKNIDTKNTREIAGWLIRPDKIVSNDGDVGMATTDTAGDDVRFFAGPNGDVWFYYVTKSGKLYATDAFITGRIEGSVIVGSEIMTDDVGVYPRSEMSSSANQIAVYQSATNYTKLSPDAFGSTPGFTFVNGSSVQAFIYLLSTTLAILTPAGSADIQLSSGKDLRLSSNTASGYATYVDSWSGFRNSVTGRTLQQDLNAKQDAITSGDVTVVSGVATLGNNINTTHLANGTVSNDEFQCLDGVTSAIQAQLDSKAKVISGNKSIQSGSTSIAVVANVEAAATVTFPVPFDTGNVPVVHAFMTGTNTGGGYKNTTVGTYSPSATGFSYAVNSPVNQTLNIGWEAIGQKT